MTQTYVAPGNFADTRIAGCHDCGWASEHGRVEAYRQVEKHVCAAPETTAPPAPAPANLPSITRPALRFYGGKWVLAPWIIEHLPEHESYIEPYAGAASVLLQKRPSRLEVYNDLDGEVVNFFRVLRDHSTELVQRLRFTPYARAELSAAAEPAIDPIERARRFFVLSWIGRGATSRTTRGWRFEIQTFHRRAPTVLFADLLDNLHALAERLRRVMIECSPALDVIERFDTPGALFYCDPPYLMESRSRRWRGDGYRHELDDEGHRVLAERLRGIQGLAVVSGYDTPLYAELYEGWTCARRMAHTDDRTKQPRVECIWISPRAAEAGIRRPFALEGMAAG